MPAGSSIQRSVVNPLVKFAFRHGIPDPGDALLETIGRRSGHPRVTPVCDGMQGDTFWVISERGRAADWVRNIASEPRVRVGVRRDFRLRWRSGTAHILDDDDIEERRRIVARGGLGRGLCVDASQALATDPVTVRIDLD